MTTSGILQQLNLIPRQSPSFWLSIRQKFTLLNPVNVTFMSTPLHEVPKVYPVSLVLLVLYTFPLLKFYQNKHTDSNLIYFLCRSCK